MCHPSPENSHKNLRNLQKVRGLAESSTVLAIRLASPRIAGFRIEVGTKVVTAKPRLSDANVGGCRKSATRTGYKRRRAVARGWLDVDDPRSDDTRDRDDIRPLHEEVGREAFLRN